MVTTPRMSMATITHVFCPVFCLVQALVRLKMKVNWKISRLERSFVSFYKICPSVLLQGSQHTSFIFLHGILQVIVSLSNSKNGIDAKICTTYIRFIIEVFLPYQVTNLFSR